MSDKNTSLMPISSMGDVQKLGESMSKSGMFGAKTPEQGMVIALTCQMRQIDPIEFRSKYHIIDGNPTMRADAMLAGLLDRGGEYKIVSRTPERAAIWAKYKAAEGEFSFSWEEAQAEPFVWRLNKTTGKHEIKTNYATERARMQMLWARVASDAVRAVCPCVNQGTYTPEEVSEFDSGDYVPTVQNVSDAGPEDATQDTAQTNQQGTEECTTATAEPVQDDPSRMPLGPKAGTPWGDLTTKELQFLAGNKKLADHPAFTPEHIFALETELESRAKEGDKANG